jgi:hypothetical protein
MNPYVRGPVLGGLFPLGLLAAALVVAAEAAPPFLVLEGTRSPDGRHAFAWGFPKRHAEAWNAVTGGGPEALDAVGNLAEEVENYLVDLERGTILARLPSSQAWRLPSGEGGNHLDLRVVWSADGAWALAVFSRRWGFESAVVYRLADGEVRGPLAVGGLVENAYREHLGRAFGDRYRRRSDRLVVSFGTLEAGADGAFLLEAYAEIPKSVADDDAFAEGVVRLSLGVGRSGAPRLESVGVVGEK